jgi:hypothetical protein
MISRTIAVTATPALVFDGSTTTANAHFIKVPRTVYLRATGADVHLGGPAVTSTDGLQISKDLTFTMVLNPGQSMYAVVATGTHTLTVLEDS